MKFWGTLVLLFAVRCEAQKISPATEDMRKNLIEAVHAATLKSAGTPAFHLEATFNTFTYDGTPDGSGTLVEDYFKAGVQRRVLTFRGVTLTQVTQGGSTHTSGTSFQSSFMVRRLVPALLAPGPSEKRLQDDPLSYRALTAGSLSLDCIVLAPPDAVGKEAAAEKLPSAYCLSTNPRLIRMIEEKYALVLTYNHFLKVADHYLAKDVSIAQHGIVRGTIHVTDFHPDPELKEADFTFPPGPDSSQQEVSPPSTFLGGALVSQVAPRYPDDAKQKHLSGTVILDALIDQTGRTSQLEVISTPSPSLAKAALDAVRQWKYKPYLVNGEPVPIRTQVAVNFFIKQ